MTTVATLCYIIKSGKVLLIKKKKGFGAGVWNGPGGKASKNESLQDCAKRGVYEKVSIVPEAPWEVGELLFYFGGKPEWRIHVFVADEYDGIERETDEAVPKWFRIDRVPYGEMWLGDDVWMPLMIAGKKFRGTLFFDEEHKELISHEIVDLDTALPATKNN